MGAYLFAAGPFVVTAGADAAALSGGGRLWLLNEGAGSARVELLAVSSQIGTVLATPTSPRFTIERFAFTGTPSGALLAPSKYGTGDADAALKLRTANTGIAFTASTNFVCRSWLPVAAATAVGVSSPFSEAFEDLCLLLPGQGLVFRQADAGTTNDTRRVILNGRWSE